MGSTTSAVSSLNLRFDFQVAVKGKTYLFQQELRTGCRGVTQWAYLKLRRKTNLRYENELPEGAIDTLIFENSDKCQ